MIIESYNPYDAVLDFVIKHAKNPYDSFLVHIRSFFGDLPGLDSIELLIYEGDDEYTWDNDWAEGSRFEVLGFIAVSDVDIPKGLNMPKEEEA